MQIYRVQIKTLYLVISIALVSGFACFWYKIAIDPSIVFLIPENSAHWIKHDKPFELTAKLNKKLKTVFRKQIHVQKKLKTVRINFKALRYFAMYFDNHLITQSPTSKISTKNDWKKTRHVELHDIKPGVHYLDILVVNYNGPPVLLAYSNELNIKTDASWSSILSPTRNQWLPVRLARDRQVVGFTKSFMPSYLAFLDKISIFLSVFTALFLMIIVGSKSRKLIFSNVYSHQLIPCFHWGIISLWVILSVVSLYNHPLGGGDFQHHFAYIKYILNNSSLPLATDGMEMFQAPLFYVTSAIFLKLFSLFFEPELSSRLLKIIPLICGLAMIEICYRTVKHAFPNKYYMQFVGMLFGAFVPMNLYMSQYIGNEPLAAVFSALAIYIMVRIIMNPSRAMEKREHYKLGVILGLGLLSKATVLLLIPLSLAFLAWIQYSLDNTFKPIVKACGRVLVTVFLISGWFYLRNWIHFDKLFIGGWDPANGFYWWQDPGYRVLQDFTTFGISLFYPIYAGTVGFWDAVYSNFWTDAGLGGFISKDGKSFWNLTYMLSLPLLSLTPTAALAVGCLSTFGKNKLVSKPLIVFSTLCVLVYLLALIYVYILVPMHSQGRATYTMGILPCYAILCAVGIERLARGTTTRALFTGLLVCWGLYSYISFFPF
jgi:hypothetical protein